MQGFIYPNEFELHWSILIVLYPYLTGLVAGAFILASLERVFNVKEVQPTYRLSLLTALAFLLVAPLPLLAHLGHPLRSYEIFLTPNRQSAMAMFGFVYAWYLMVVLLLEIWFDYRKDLVLWARQATGVRRWMYYALTLGATDLSERSLRFDPLRLPAPWLRRLHLRLGEGESLVEQRVDARGVSILGHRLGDRTGPGHLYVLQPAALETHRHEVCR